MQAIKGIIAATALMFALVLTPNSVTASPATGDEPWGEFGFGGAGTEAFACPSCDPSSGGNSFYLGDPPWTFTGSGFLIVQDAFLIGDQFRVLDNGLEIGLTSTPIGTGNCGSDPDLCFTNDNISKGIFALSAGAHSFRIFQIAGISGAGFLCVSTSDESCSPVTPDVPVPEPSSLLLLGLALAGAVCWSRREQLRKCYVVLSRKRRRR